MTSLQYPTGNVKDPDLKTSLLSFTNCANRGLVLFANTSAQVAPANPARISLIVINLSDSVVFLNLGQERASVGQGLVLFGKRSYLEISVNFLFREKISAISETPSALSLIECSL